MDIKGFGATLQTAFIGCQIEHHSQVASTNDIAIARGKAGAAEGTVVIAEHQTAGRGRYGRRWEAPTGKCLLVSIVLRHRLLQDQIHLPNLIGALAIARAIRTKYGLDTQIKPPNDVRIKKRKVAGVLTELAYDTKQQSFFVLGFGVNVNITLADLPPELRETATSLRIASADAENQDAEICRGSLLHAIFVELENTYLQLKAGETDLIMNQFEALREIVPLRHNLS
ncbi:biotin--[acetyl-CoA-carboxylase] ligase [Candidatus Poribacteria bacterium]|nr:biotin--[acetyl-CoA-carboxylase] ligase [Candidatus Poribacteria bacterium]MYK20769.1 biotin--[acetyl-CoA-carboxylase] ligase [Candidatus Poribacteria bacterium]